MEAEHFVIGSIVDALFVRGLGDRLDSACRSELREAGLDLDRPLLSRYLIETWRQCTEIVVRHAFADLEVEAAHLELGSTLVQAYVASPLGSNLAPALRETTPVRALELAVMHLRLGNRPSVQPRITQLAAGDFEVWFPNLGPHPHLMRGALHAALSFASVTDLSVQLVAGQPACTMRVSWKAANLFAGG